jgi:hypothetical protein
MGGVLNRLEENRLLLEDQMTARKSLEDTLGLA